MIGRGSRVTQNKKSFTIVDLGNNLLRFGPWNESVDWNHIFKYPEMYLENIRNDEDIERDFVYEMPDHLKKRFKNSKLTEFDMKGIYKDAINSGKKAFTAIESSIENHSKMCLENSEDVFDARALAKELQDDIAFRVKQYCYCIMNSTDNYRDYLIEEYNRRLRLSFNGKF